MIVVTLAVIAMAVFTLEVELVVALVVAALKARVVALVSVALGEERVVDALAENIVIVSNDSIERCKTNLKIIQ